MSKSKFWAQDEILIVDDDDLQRELMKNSLEDMGLDIHEAANGAEALEVFRERSPMLVVMDIHMPVMDGFTACQEMKRLCGGDGAAIILVTGMEDLESVQKAYDMGAIEFITKPFDWRLLRMRVKYILRIQQTYLGVQTNIEKLAWAQRAAGVGSWQLDPQTGQMCLSDEVVRMLGMKNDSHCFSIKEFGAAVHQVDQKPLYLAYKRLLAEGIPMDMDISLDLDGLKSVILHIYGEQLLDDNGHPLGLNGTVQDITERKAAEDKIREASAMKDQFLANISHEMRTPINGMMGMADLLELSTLDEDQKMLVGHIVESSQHLLSVLNDVLDFSAMEAGSIRIESGSFQLSKVVTSSGQLIQVLARKKKLELFIDMAADLPETVSGDIGRIKQILLNLAGNAVKFTEQGSISIIVSLEDRDSEKCHIRFTVKDTGIGIPIEKQAIVFDQFVQADGSLTRKFGGTGLGLAISKELVGLMGGTMGLKSQEGEGTEVWFILPLATSNAGERAPVKVKAQAKVHPNQTAEVKILLVEDNRINQLFTKKILEKLGFRVDVADNGLEALDKVQSESYGVVLMDCQMPVMDGYEATRRIRQLGSDYEKLPIIALTAHALAGDKEKCLESGMDDYMTKPFVGTGLVQFIQKWLNLDQTIGV